MSFKQRMIMSLWSFIKLQRGMNKFKEACQLRTDCVENEKSDLLADCHSTFNGRRNYFCQLINVHGFNHFS
jgi:hypothetical protein